MPSYSLPLHLLFTAGSLLRYIDDILVRSTCVKILMYIRGEDYTQADCL